MVAMTSESIFRPARPKRAFDEIIAQIRTLVQQGELPPGSRLPSERALAEQFEVSRNTVREAIRMLEITGLVTVKKGATGGPFISTASSSTISKTLADSLMLTQYAPTDLTSAREGIEAHVVRVACAERTEADLARMDRLLDEAEQLAAEHRWNEKAVLVIELHNLIGDATQNPILATVMRSLMELLSEFSRRLGGERRGLEHQRRLVQLIRDRDADGAVAELVQNTRRVHDMWLVNTPTETRPT